MPFIASSEARQPTLPIQATDRLSLKRLNENLPYLQRDIKTKSLVFLQEEYKMKIPISELRKRVTGVDEESYFFLSGLKACGDMLRHIPSHKSIETILDFGCGCGRMTYFLCKNPNWKVYAIEPDKECFEASKLFVPEATYLENLQGEKKFDLIICASVFSHIGLAGQHFYIPELISKLTDGGVMVASFHSEDCYKVVFGKELDPEEIEWSTDKDCFQMRDITIEQWSKYAKVIHHEKLGYNHFQDIVTMQKA